MTERKPGQGSETRKATAYMPQVRMEPEDYKRAVAALRAAGKSWPEFAREKLLGDEAPRPAARGRLLPEEQAIRQLIGQLGYIGNNLNQLTHLANMGDLERPAELDRTLQMVLDVAGNCARLIGRKPA